MVGSGNLDCGSSGEFLNNVTLGYVFSMTPYIQRGGFVTNLIIYQEASIYNVFSPCGKIIHCKQEPQ